MPPGKNKLTMKQHLVYKLDELLTVNEFAKRMGVKIGTVRSWIYKRVVPFTRFQRRVYFSHAVVEELLGHNAIPALSSGGSPDPMPMRQGGEEKTKGNTE
jgi:excisionase family DNA binding protein